MIKSKRIQIIHINLLNVQSQKIKINNNSKIITIYNKLRINKINKKSIKINKKMNIFNKYSKMNSKYKFYQIPKKRIN